MRRHHDQDGWLTVTILDGDWKGESLIRFRRPDYGPKSAPDVVALKRKQRAEAHEVYRQIAELTKQGLSAVKIAAQVGRCHSTVSKIIRESGLRPKKPHNRAHK